MTAHVWRAAAAGVMLWEPAAAALAISAPQEPREHEQERPQLLTENDIQDMILVDYDQDEQDHNLPSIEDVFETPVRTEPGSELHLSSPRSSSPSVARSGPESPTPNTSPLPTLRLRSASSTSSDLLNISNILGQLQGFAQSFGEDLQDPLRISPSSSTYDSDSDHTDFRPTSFSPCPQRNTAAKPPKIYTTSHHFDDTRAIKPRKPLKRALDFDMVTVRNTSKKRRSPIRSPRHSPEIPTLRKLRAIERAPPHQWDEDERELLTVIYRWYTAVDPKIIPKIFNEVTGLDLRPSIVRSQFDSHLKLYGGRAYPEYGRAMEVPFKDSYGVYTEIRNIIEETASNLGLELFLRKREVNVISGQAQYAKSPQTRRYWKSLVRRAAQHEKEKTRRVQSSSVKRPSAQVPSLQVPSLGGRVLVITPTLEDCEFLTDVEDLAAPVVSTTEIRPSLPSTSSRIGFRVWDADSRTKFSEESGFVSEAFSIWKNEFLPPFSPDGQGRQALLLLTNMHLSMSGGASTFVSVGTSLLQVMVKASTMDNPRIAVVALDHPLLTVPNKTLHAAEVLRMLKGEKQAWWARYKGHAERMVWASVPRAAVITHLPLSDLQTLSNNSLSCANTLHLDEFRLGRRTRHISDQLKTKKIVLNTATARAMGEISLTFGLDGESVSLEHIQDFISRLVDGWQISKHPLSDIHTNSSIATTFAMSLSSQIHRVQDVMVAFLNGIQQGTDTIAYYARRRPGFRRMGNSETARPRSRL